MADVQFNPESKDIDQLQGQGLRAYVLQDYETACRIYSNVSELLVEKHQSDLHDDLGDVYLNYGKSLLELSRKEGDAINDGVIKNVPDDDEDDDDGDEDHDDDGGDNNGGGDQEDEEEQGDVDEDKEGGEEEGDAKAEEKAKEGDEKKEGGDEKKKKEECESNGAGGGGGGGANAEAVAGTSADAQDSVEKAEEAEEDASDLQLAWEVLELAKQIFTNRGEAGRKLLAETLVVLGEVALESGNYKPGIDDMTEGLRIQKSLFPEDSRVVAETSFILGGAYSSDGQIDQSIASYEECLRLLEKRLANLKAAATNENADEIEEITGLIPDVSEKVADMMSFKEEIAKREAKKNAEAAPSNGTAASSSSSKQASDISHLVKRKRKSEDPDPAQPLSKKPTPEK